MTNVPAEYIRTASDRAAIAQGCYFDPDAAERVRKFCRTILRHCKQPWTGKPCDPLPWQWDQIIAPLYGWKRANGTRRFRRFACALPKKNGKSSLLAWLALYHLVADGERGAEVYTAANDKKQAAIIWRYAAEMVQVSESLTGILRCVRSEKSIYDDETSSQFTALSSDVANKEGYNASAVFFDELHSQPNWDLWNVLRYAGISRRQPLLGWISTAGFDKDSICYEQWQAAKDVQESKTIDTELLACIYETREDADWKSPVVWKAANPSYGVTMDADSFAMDCKEAAGSAVKENAFKRYRLNMWTAGETKWISEEDWRNCHVPFDENALAGQPCVVGLDLATTTDIVALVLNFKTEDEVYKLIPRFWVPRDTMLKRETGNKTRISKWAKQYITVTEGNVIDYNVIRNEINDLADMYKITEIAIDAWNHSQITTDLQGDGFKVTPVRTGFISISPATKEFERLVLCGQIAHNSNPVMNWMVNNCIVETDASGNLKPSKVKSAEKIDGVVAAILSLAIHITRIKKKPSKYETEGVTSI